MARPHLAVNRADLPDVMQVRCPRCLRILEVVSAIFDDGNEDALARFLADHDAECAATS